MSHQLLNEMKIIGLILCMSLYSMLSSADDSIWIIKPKFDDASLFSEDRAIVKVGNKFGYIDREGNYVVQPIYEAARDFKDGMAAVCNHRDYWGFINTSGKVIIPLLYRNVKDFNEGAAAYYSSLDKKWGFIDKNGEKIIGAVYDDVISSFNGGYAHVSRDGVKSFINKAAKCVCSEVYEIFKYIKMSKIEQEYNGSIPELFPVEYNGKWGYQRFTLNNYLAKEVSTFENYLSKNNLMPIEEYETYMKNNIEREVNQWQIKGEFETTSAWKERVNETTRNELIKKLSSKYHSKYNSKVKLYKKMYDRLAKKYKDDYKVCIETYYKMCSSSKELAFKRINYELMAYDADNETYLIKSDDKFGDILLPVPIDEAQNFKQNWNEIKRNIEPTFTPSGDDVVLTSVTVTNGKKKYVYDSHTQAKYAVTDINYNFEPMDISSLDLKREISYNFDEVEVLQNSVVQTAPKVKGIDSSNKNIEHKSLQANVQSDVDINIPQNKLNENSNTFALIIANEHYQNVTKVEHANNDGKLFAEYCEKTLGIPQKHIMLYDDATLGNMLGAINRIKDIGSAYNGNLNIIFYYAGHGIPDEESKDAFLLPVDGNASSPRTCYKQSELYSELAGVKAKSVMVFMDACFSGAQRGDGMLMASRGVAIKAKSTNPLGNMVVFSAAQGDETAYPYKEQKHGMFTYYLLKKLQETKGDVTLGELSDYVTAEVKKTSIVANGKMQTPTLLSSPQIANDWRNWKLR